MLLYACICYHEWKWIGIQHGASPDPSNQLLYQAELTGGDLEELSPTNKLMERTEDNLRTACGMWQPSARWTMLMNSVTACHSMCSYG
jgi:hypothetical protein